MKLLFRRVGADEVEQEPTQRDQFNSDEVGLAETLIRESLQNSLDARSPTAGSVRVRITISEPDEKYGSYWDTLLKHLAPHLDAAGVDTAGVNWKLPRMMVIEDFGTTGLTGQWKAKDNGNFSDFWRRMGRSHKGGTKGGRWGLGKLVYFSAKAVSMGATARSPSQIDFVFGLRRSPRRRLHRTLARTVIPAYTSILHRVGV